MDNEMKGIRDLCDAYYKGEVEMDFLRDWVKEWQRLTRLIIVNGKYVLLFTELERIKDEVADHQNTDVEIPVYRPKLFKKNTYREALKRKVKITDIARGYGLKVDRNKCVCPFHGDTDPSLGLSDEKGVFHCFGCGVKGDTLTFIKMMEEREVGNKRGSRPDTKAEVRD